MVGGRVVKISLEKSPEKAEIERFTEEYYWLFRESASRMRLSEKTFQKNFSKVKLPKNDFQTRFSFLKLPRYFFQETIFQHETDNPTPPPHRNN